MMARLQGDEGLVHAAVAFHGSPSCSVFPFCLSSIKAGIDRTVLGILVSYQVKVKLTVSG